VSSCPPKMSTIILITLSGKVIVFKKTIIINPFMPPPPHNNHHPVSTLYNALPSISPLPLPPHVDCRVPPLLTPACRHQHCENAHHIRNNIPCQRTTPNTPAIANKSKPNSASKATLLPSLQLRPVPLAT
jgi:hypothetical protein